MEGVVLILVVVALCLVEPWAVASHCRRNGGCPEHPVKR
jgi:hypothetical protein